MSAGSQVCVGSTITLSPTTGGTWINSNANATVTNAGVVTGVLAGTATFTFTQTGTLYNATTTSVTINALPVVTAGLQVCIGSTITLSPTTGGTWTSSDDAKATVTNAGEVTGKSVGDVTFTFTYTSTGCRNTTSSITVSPNLICAKYNGDYFANTPSTTTGGVATVLIQLEHKFMQ